MGHKTPKRNLLVSTRGIASHSHPHVLTGTDQRIGGGMMVEVCFLDQANHTEGGRTLAVSVLPTNDTLRDNAIAYILKNKPPASQEDPTRKQGSQENTHIA